MWRTMASLSRGMVRRPERLFIDFVPRGHVKAEISTVLQDGVFNIAAVNWPESVDTDAKKCPPLRVLAYPFSRWPDKQGERGNE